MDWDSTKRDLERDYTFQDVDKSQQGMYRPQQYMTRPQQNMRRPRDKQPRVKEACYGCFKRHCKCNNIKPCERCKKIGLPCTTKRTKSSSEANLTIENGSLLKVGVDVSALSFDVTDALSTDVAESSLRAYQDKPTMDMVSNDLSRFYESNLYQCIDRQITSPRNMQVEVRNSNLISVHTPEHLNWDRQILQDTNQLQYRYNYTPFDPRLPIIFKDENVPRSMSQNDYSTSGLEQQHQAMPPFVNSFSVNNSPAQNVFAPPVTSNIQDYWQASTYKDEFEGNYFVYGSSSVVDETIFQFRPISPKLVSPNSDIQNWVSPTTSGSSDNIDDTMSFF